MDYTNRRKHLRIPYSGPLTLWLVNRSDETMLDNTTDVALGGLGVNLNQWLSVGTKVGIQLGFEDESFRCSGKVVRYLKKNESNYNTGIEFEPLDDLKQALLGQSLSKIVDSRKFTGDTYVIPPK